jgi:hypothetical protein
MMIVFAALRAVAWCLFCALAVLFLYLYINGQIGAGPDHPVIEYKDFVTILLTALAVMIAVATVVVAVAAVWGYVAIRDEISRTVKEIAGKRAEEVARDRIEAIAPGLVKEIIRFDEQLSESRSDDIAKEYSKEGEKKGGSNG